jgi:formate hydrogenlyase subunit 4
MNATSAIPPLLGMLFAPLLLGIINRTKAVVAGRNGQPLLQVYYDLWRLLHKGSVYSRTTSWLFRAGPVVGLAAVLVALLIVPFGAVPGPLAFPGDLIVFAGLLGLMRFFTVVAALDTGSSFEGMGASREVQFASLAEPVFYLALAALVQRTGAWSLTGIYAALSFPAWAAAGAALALAAVALFIVFLAENSRIPVDDPTTHLELTMIHEVMVLDHSGPDFAFITYGAALKHWVLGSLLVGLVFPVHTGRIWLDVPAALLAIALLAVAVGLVESTMARLRLLRVPQLLVGAGALCALAVVLGLMR